MARATADPTRILVVEDEFLLLLLLEGILTDLGHEATLCGCCADALARMQQQPSFDLAIIDLGLPDGDGAELIAALWARAPKTKVIVSTGYSDLPPALEPAQRAGRLILLTKPYGPIDLERAIQRLLGRVRRRGVRDSVAVIDDVDEQELRCPCDKACSAPHG